MPTQASDPTPTADDTDVPAPDVQSDPALDDGESTDWASEGGAATEGPATDTDNS